MSPTQAPSSVPPPFAHCTFVHDRQLDLSDSGDPVHRVQRTLETLGVDISPEDMSIRVQGQFWIMSASL
jgi:hypothetical protein